MGKPQQRSSDGVTFNKVLVGTTGSAFLIFISLVSYVFISSQDRTEKTFDKMGKGIENVAKELRRVSDSQIAAYSHLQNNDAKIERIESENKKFREETRLYWSNK